MIVQLTGTIKYLDHGQIIVDVNGVGYLVHVGSLTTQQLDFTQPQTLAIYTHVREEALELYGFRSWEERQAFMQVLSVSGVGPKTALSLIDQGSQNLIAAIQQADLSFFTKIPRVGKKLAQKIIIELGSKLGELQSLNLAPDTPMVAELKQALQQLGFAEQKINQVIEQLPISELSLDQAVKQSLQKLKQL